MDAGAEDIFSGDNLNPERAMGELEPNKTGSARRAKAKSVCCAAQTADHSLSVPGKRHSGRAIDFFNMRIGGSVSVWSFVLDLKKR